ncbi:hypothetical protein GLP40_25585 [Nocardia sp. CT2-14]|uniref:Uncharacterized protein n=2 Tax=Nocardia aurantiaca TaxID=2675850 RepID=A0A6I3L585_9NOCA|nr:hypothetical protein [Nocardia aurantiaca]
MGAVALTAACGGNSSPGSTQPQGSSSSLTSTAGKPTTTGGPTTSVNGTTPLNVSDDAAKQLCDMLRPQLSDWRVQGPTLGKISLNATVIQWAAQNGLFLPNDRGVVDRVTAKSCSDVRDQAISALEIPNLAAGLVAG